jgi:hypothetical protein
MRTYTIVLFLLLAILFSSCGNSQETFPTHINVYKTEDLKRIKGTKLFVYVPDTYKPFEKLGRLQKDHQEFFLDFQLIRRRLFTSAFRRFGHNSFAVPLAEYNFLTE